MTAQPTLPFIASSRTSREAAQSARAFADTARQKVKTCIYIHGPVTDEFIAECTGLNPSTVRPRRVELERDGEIRRHPIDGVTASGRRAARWVAVEDDDEVWDERAGRYRQTQDVEGL